MAQRREIQVMVSMEMTVSQALQVAIQKDEISASSYLRSLLIEDLQKRGLLTDSMLAQMAK